MARQKGIIKLKGTVGDISFYKSKDGYLAREKGGVDAERIANDPAFQRTRENGSEFGEAGRTGKLIRDAFRLQLQSASDNRVTSRLTKELMKVLKTDFNNARGQRKVEGGDLQLLKGFEFNANGKLGNTLYADYQLSIDRSGGTVDVSFEDFIPQADIAYPAGATHLKLIAAVGAIDFADKSYEVGKGQSADLVIGPQLESGHVLSLSMTPDTQSVLFIVVGLDFLQDVNGVKYPLKNNAFNPLQLIRIDPYVISAPL